MKTRFLFYLAVALFAALREKKKLPRALTLEVTTGLDTGLNMSSFGEANNGEIYVVSYDGRLFHITD
jgi:hypothetical protein